MTSRSLRWLWITALAAFAVACAGSPHGSPPTTNRDRHGPADVATYVERLQRPERVRELDPQGVIRALSMPRDAVVADIGVGPGVMALPIARHLSEGLVYGVDVEPAQLDALRAHLLDEGIHNVVPVLASYSDPHLPPHGVDWILIVDTYHHLEGRVAYLRTLRSDLTQGGRLVILEYKPGQLAVGPPADHKISHEQRYGELREAGFELERRFETHRFHDFEVWRQATDAD